MNVQLKSFVAPFLSLALMFVLAASVAAPVRMHAQEPATHEAAQPGAAELKKDEQAAASQNANTDPTSRKPIKYQKEEGENVFRHTQLVKTVSGIVFHDANASEEVQQTHIEITARIFEWINFGIIFLAIVLPLLKFLPKALKKRRETLSQHLEEARKTTADANSRLSAVEAQLSKLDEEIAKIRAQVEDEIKQDEARIKSSITEEAARIVASAEQEIAVAAAQAQRGLKAFAADLAIDQAVKNLTLTAEHDKALIEEFVAEAGKGGKN